MKAFLLLVISMSSISVFAQQKQNDYKSIYELMKRKTFVDDKIKFEFPSSYHNDKTKASSYQVIKLPLDNMPCLVPDMKGFNMPVAGFSPSGRLVMPVR